MIISEISQLTKSQINEAESNTAASKEIRLALTAAGYKKLGSGADATVWAKKKSNDVIRILMPDGGEGAGAAAQVFYKFYEFCQKNQNIQNLPVFFRITDKDHAEFTADGKNYVMIGLERLSPIPNGSFQEAMVWILSDLATKKISWDKALKIIRDESTWEGYEGGLDAVYILQTIDRLDEKDLLEYEVLFKLMTLLYHTGRINKIGWDLHTENAMMRGDTIVVTDPWFTLSTDH